MGVSMEPSQADLARARGIVSNIEQLHFRVDGIVLTAGARVNMENAIATALQEQRREFWDAIAEGLRCSGSTLDVTTIQHAHELPRLIQQAQRERLCAIIREN